MSYNELFDEIYGDTWSDAKWAALDSDTKAAWNILKVLDGRKSFEWWWRGDDFPPECRDEIFDEIRETVRQARQ